MAQRSGNLFRWDDLPCCEARGTKGHAVPVDYTPAKHRQPIHHSTQFGGAQTQAAQASVERVGGRSEALSDFPCAQHIWPDSVTGHRQCRSQPTLLSGTRATATAVVSKVSLHVKQAANEPSTGLFYVQEHVTKSAHQLLANQVRVLLATRRSL